HYGAVEGALASGFATAELHHLWGHDLSVPETASGPFPPLPLENKGEFVDVDSCAVERTVATQTCFSLLSSVFVPK
ncbi:hypothetical protein GOB10_29980, partial [Sinorhizobium meliloti]|nr:hypothetical protein [Sinorhizobium meliloti]